MKRLTIKLSVIIAFSMISVSCSNSKKDFEVNNYYLNNFTLDQLDKDGREVFKLESSKASIDPITNDIIAQNIKVIISGPSNNLFNLIKSNDCKLDKLNNILFLKNEVMFINKNDKDSFIEADNLIWDINKSEIKIDGNLKLRYQQSVLNSDSALYDKKKETITFTGITNYSIYSNKNPKANPIVKLTSDAAEINNKTKEIKFTSSRSQVISVIDIDSF